MFDFSGNLPFGTNYFVLLVSFMFIIFIVVVSCGGIVKLPFYLGGIELRGRRAAPTITSTSEPQVCVKLTYLHIFNTPHI